MANIIFTKGAPGSGKSTFLAKHGLSSYTISPDNIRLLYSSPQITLAGALEIDQSNDKRVWSDMMSIIENRMHKGDFLVIDATHTKAGDFSKYKPLVSKYRYKAFCLDFSDVELEICIQRNREREPHKQVSDNIIELMHARSQTSKVPSWIQTLDLATFDQWLNPPLKDLSHYKKIHHIGDIQGCYTVLHDYLSKRSQADDELFIFLGDYLDRGIENDLVLAYILELFANNDNMIFLEGNHDKHLWHWASEQEIFSNEFRTNTQHQLEEAAINKKAVRNFCRHLKQYFYYKYNDKHIFISHGGVSNIPLVPKLVSDRQYIGGFGHYSDYLINDRNFDKNTADYCFSLHGHRNVSNHPVQISERCFNLEGEVEFGGELRIVTLSENGFETVELTNTIYNRNSSPEVDIRIPVDEDNLDMITSLRSNKLIKEFTFEHNIASFNYKREAFFKRIWNEQTIKARGLFVNTKNYQVVARSYEKFFNIGEMDYTEYDFLKHNFAYPVKSYVKENGYLGILGYNAQFDELVFASKTSIVSDHAKWFKELFTDKFATRIDELKHLLHETNISLVFEVIDPMRDSHIIEYTQSQIVLLDAIHRRLEFSKLTYEYLHELAERFGFAIKQIDQIISNEEDFEQYYMLNTGRDHQEASPEGYVLEDSAGRMVKLKLPYYSYWRSIREYLVNLQKNPQARVRQELLQDPLFVEFQKWLQKQDGQYVHKPITELRKLFLASR